MKLWRLISVSGVILILLVLLGLENNNFLIETLAEVIGSLIGGGAVEYILYQKNKEEKREEQKQLNNRLNTIEKKVDTLQILNNLEDFRKYSDDLKKVTQELKEARDKTEFELIAWYCEILHHGEYMHINDGDIRHGFNPRLKIRYQGKVYDVEEIYKKLKELDGCPYGNNYLYRYPFL